MADNRSFSRFPKSVVKWQACLALLAAQLGCNGAFNFSQPQTSASSTTANTNPAPSLQTTSQALITVGSQTAKTIGSDFIGFSYEKSMLSSNLFNSGNAALIALFSKWGPGILRVGGNTVNETTWNATGAGSTSGQTAPADVDRLAGFLKASKWKVVYGLNATTSSTTTSAAEAAYAKQSLGDSLQDFEIGNEPDLYYENGLEATNFTFANFLSDWDGYVAAIRASAPGATFSGPASAYNYYDYTDPFAADRGSEIEFLTNHYYRANGQLSTSTIDFLLTPDTSLPTELTAIEAAAANNNIPKCYRMAETNSYYNGGAPNVSDGFGTALWLIEYCFTLAQYGAEGANFHGGGDGPGYSPIANSLSGVVEQARAEYYGMLLFSMMGPGTLLQTTVSGTASALMSYAVMKADGSVSVVLANNSRTDVVAATVHMPASVSSAQALLLTAPSLDVTTGMTFGGSAIGTDGSWSARTVYTLPVTSTTAVIDVPSGSAYLIQSLN